MIGLDTNVLIRYLTRDDHEQWERASQIIQENQPCFISNVVLCEVVWVLRGRPYQIGKDEIIATLEMRVQSCGFEARKPFFGYQALQRTKQGGADFSYHFSLKMHLIACGGRLGLYSPSLLD